MSEEAAFPPATPLQRGMDALSNVAIAVAVAALLGLVVVQGWQVIARYVINDSPSWTEPVTVLLLTTAMSLGAAAGVHTNRHFGFFLLADAVGPRLKKALHAVSPLVIAAIGAVMAYWGAVLLFDGLDIRIAGAPMPQSIGYLPLSLGGLLMVVFALYRMFLVLRAPPTDEAR
ncbi:TRAP transporter small permease [Pseudoxanthomonas mexicana]|uniref:TRAP transporter small permease n=1 Tax=Pseudoxanthomonas mexicana TaxID=128785 RepID=UPI00289D85C8|nr:TRAP transporter small permease [Pseudoxanthomonas mexicana]